MQTIWKFPIRTTDVQDVAMPSGAQILTVQVQAEAPCIWARVDTDNPVETTRRIRIFGTGHPIPPTEKLNYIATYQLHGGALVFHVFESVAGEVA